VYATHIQVAFKWVLLGVSMMLKNIERKVEKEYGITRKKIQLAFPDNGDMR
jgi:hypothetical protein